MPMHKYLFSLIVVILAVTIYFGMYNKTDHVDPKVRAASVKLKSGENAAYRKNKVSQNEKIGYNDDNGEPIEDIKVNNTQENNDNSTNENISNVNPEISINSLSKIASNDDWLRQIAENSDDKSLEREQTIIEWLYRQESAVQSDILVRCGRNFCGVLLSNMNSEKQADSLIEKIKNYEQKGSFVHYFYQKDEYGNLNLRILLPMDPSAEIDRFILN